MWLSGRCTLVKGVRALVRPTPPLDCQCNTGKVDPAVPVFPTGWADFPPPGPSFPAGPEKEICGIVSC